MTWVFTHFLPVLHMPSSYRALPSSHLALPSLGNLKYRIGKQQMTLSQIFSALESRRDELSITGNAL
jgi:hypothetical protein